MEVVYRILCIHLGTPPEHFDWQWTDKDKKFYREGVLTPQEFAAKYVDLPVSEYVCLVNDPRPSSPTGRTFTVEYLGNVIGGPPVIYLNVGMQVIKDVAAATIQGGEPVWFGCDVGKMMSNDYAFWDAGLYDLPSVYDTAFDLDKAARLAYHESAMTHAMLFTGVDVLDGVTRRWRVENSWGSDRGKDGFFTMNDSWFSQYVFEIAARKSALPADLQSALDAEPIVLPAWDPIGVMVVSFIIAVLFNLGRPWWVAAHPCYERLRPDPTPASRIPFEDFLARRSQAIRQRDGPARDRRDDCEARFSCDLRDTLRPGWPRIRAARSLPGQGPGASTSGRARRGRPSWRRPVRRPWSTRPRA